MEKNDAIHETVKFGDHSALGIIDRFGHTQNNIDTVFLESGDINWTNELETIVDNYNNTLHESITIIHQTMYYTNRPHKLKCCI